jgi:hypothetical protein
VSCCISVGAVLDGWFVNAPELVAEANHFKIENRFQFSNLFSKMKKHINLRAFNSMWPF